MSEDVQLDYWEEIISQSCEEHGVRITAAQARDVARDIQVSHENWGMAFPQPSGGSHLLSEIDDLKRQIETERNKITCPECVGRGSLVSHGPHHSATFGCHKCRGEGRVSP